MNFKYIAALVAIVLVVIIGLTVTRAPQSETPVSGDSIQASFYPVYYFATRIAGEKAQVQNITPADVEPHDYEPTPQQIVNIENSKMLILLGDMESWGARLKQTIDPNKTLVVTTTEGLELLQMEEDGVMMSDPHIWLSPPLAQAMVRKITQGFAQADPGNKYYYELNANGLLTDLENLDRDFKEGLARCAKKDFVTSHAAFSYLASSYGLRQVPIAGLSPEEEPSAKDLASIADFAKKENIRVIFFESLVSPKLSQTIAQEIGAQTMVLDPIEGLSSEDIAAGKNYFTQMRQNLANLKIALECR